MRLIGIVLVVIGHSTYFTIHGADYYAFFTGLGHSTIYQFMSRVAAFIYTFHMSFFFFLSGLTFFLVEEKYPSLDLLLVDKFKSLIIPYFITGLFFMIPIKYFFTSFYGDDSLRRVLFRFMTFYHDTQVYTGHLWFLLTLFWIFPIFYIIHKIFLKNDLFTIIFIIFLTYFAPYFNLILPGYGSISSNYYLLFFTIGYFYSKYIQKQPVIVPFVSLLLPVLYLISVRFNNTDLLTLTSMLLKIFITVNICILLYQEKEKEKKKNPVMVYSFMIYLLHDPLQYIILPSFESLGKLNINIEIYYLLFFFVRIVLTIIVCIALAKIISYITQKVSLNINNIITKRKDSHG
jgi:fucose 4-O-acetylase-like acetyltransferase